MGGRRFISKHNAADLGGGDTSQYTFLVDEHPTTGAGWFPFRIKSDFTKCVRVRRGSDSAEVDVYTDPNPAVRISLNSMTSAGITLGQWIGSVNAVVKIAYDMTGNGFDYIQLNTARQPFLVQSGVLCTDPETGKVALYGSGQQELRAITSSFPGAGDPTISYFGIHRQIYQVLSHGLAGIMPGVAADDRRGFYINDEPDRAIRYRGGNAVFDSTLPNVSTIQKTIIKQPSATPEYWEWGVKRTVTGEGANHTLNIQADSAFSLLSTPNGSSGTTYDLVSSVEGYMSGQIWYFTDQSANRTAIEAFINP